VFLPLFEKQIKEIPKEIPNIITKQTLFKISSN
jgi:hypothetical protein